MSSWSTALPIGFDLKLERSKKSMWKSQGRSKRGISFPVRNQKLLLFTFKLVAWPINLRVTS